MSSERLNAFSDGVIAILITIMVLELRVPHGTDLSALDTLLPAQPGVGELALKARPMVVPAFITGMTNSLWHELRANWRREPKVIAVFGEPIDLSPFPSETRLVHHKRCSDLFCARIYALMEEEKQLRRERSPPA